MLAIVIDTDTILLGTGEVLTVNTKPYDHGEFVRCHKTTQKLEFAQNLFDGSNHSIIIVERLLKLYASYLNKPLLTQKEMVGALLNDSNRKRHNSLCVPLRRKNYATKV